MNKRSPAPALVLWLFPVVVLALIVGLVLGLLALGRSLDSGTLGYRLVLFIAVPLIIAVVAGVRQALRLRPEPAEGIDVERADHPALWGQVTELAALAETAPPDRIVIVPEVNACVAEVAGRRELEIGLPLLAVMTRGELRAVIAHELGHFAGGDTAYSSRIRGRLALIYSVRDRVGPVWRWFFTLYGGLFSLVSGADSRRAELRADELALEAAGPDDAAGSFRSLYRAAAAWEVVDEHYAELFEAAGCRASLSEAVAMVARVNREEIDKAVEEDIATEKASAFDTHPPARERIARFEAARGTGPTRTDDAPALDLVGGAWLASAEGDLLVRKQPLAGWDRVIPDGVRGTIDHQTEQLGAFLRRSEGGAGDLAQMLALLDHADGAVAHVTGESGDLAREETVDTLLAPVLSALLAADAARIEVSWDSPYAVVAPDGSPLAVREAVEAAVDASSSAGLVAWLTECGVDVTAATLAQPRQATWLAAASQMTGPWEGRRDVHIWSTGVLAGPELDRGLVKEAKEQYNEEHQHPRLYGEAARGLDAGRARPGALWWDAGSIEEGDVASRLTKLRLRFSLMEGTSHELVSTLETAIVDSPEALGEAWSYLTSPKA